jgi:DNA (cytosine-5)-methyltransferase 1
VPIQDGRDISKQQNGIGVGQAGDPAYTLDTTGSQAMAQSMTVRRLTPRECERLQGFPDNWTLIPWRGKPADQCPDGPRYKALGNSMAVNCMEWIGERIQGLSK